MSFPLIKGLDYQCGLLGRLQRGALRRRPGARRELVVQRGLPAVGLFPVTTNNCYFRADP